MTRRRPDTAAAKGIGRTREPGRRPIGRRPELRFEYIQKNGWTTPFAGVEISARMP